MALAIPATYYDYYTPDEQHQHLFAMVEEFADLVNSTEDNGHSVSILFGVIVDYFGSHVSEENKNVPGCECNEHYAAFQSNAKRLKANIKDQRLGYKKLAATFLKNAINTHCASQLCHRN